MIVKTAVVKAKKTCIKKNIVGVIGNIKYNYVTPKAGQVTRGKKLCKKYQIIDACRKLSSLVRADFHEICTRLSERLTRSSGQGCSDLT